MGLVEEYKQETNEEYKKKKKKQIRTWSFRLWIIKNKWWIIVSLIILCLILFPEQIGTFIGTWIDKFLGSIVKNINF